MLSLGKHNGYRIIKYETYININYQDIYQPSMVKKNLFYYSKSEK